MGDMLLHASFGFVVAILLTGVYFATKRSAFSLGLEKAVVTRRVLQEVLYNQFGDSLTDAHRHTISSAVVELALERVLSPGGSHDSISLMNRIDDVCEMCEMDTAQMKLVCQKLVDDTTQKFVDSDKFIARRYKRHMNSVASAIKNINSEEKN